MKKLLKSNLFTQVSSSQRLTLLVSIILLFTLPFLVWAIVTQRFDLRKRAATVGQPIICWNRVQKQDPNNPYWQTPCSRYPNPGICAQVTDPLTCDEINVFNNWVDALCPRKIECGDLQSGFVCQKLPIPTKCQTQSEAYTLEPLPSPNITMTVSTPNTGYGIYVILRNNNVVVTDQQGISYDWTIDDPTVATIEPFAPNPAPGQPCNTYGIQQPCPRSHASIRGLKVGSTVIHVSASRTLGSGPTVIIASTSFNLTVTPGQNHNLKFKVKLAGVDGGGAEGEHMTIRFTNSNVDLAVFPVPNLTHVGNGVYEANISLPEDQLPVGSGYRIIVKTGKSLGRKYCYRTGQSEPCTDLNASITIDYATDPFVFDFTGLPLDPGDIYMQNGLANQEDFNKIFTQMSYPCGTTTTEYQAADLNYSGCVNSLDALLMRKTLETRYDDN